MLWGLLIIFLIGRPVLGQKRGETASCNPENLIQGGKTSQSSTYRSHTSDRAVDGNNTHCAHTDPRPGSWWEIDLQGLYEVSCITIHNKAQDNINLTGAEIFVGNSSDGEVTQNKRCATIQTTTIGETLHFTCPGGVVGRYVTVYITRKEFMILCEVKIYSTRRDFAFIGNLILIKQKKTWEDALYYCRDNHRELVSILDENTQDWAGHLAKIATTDFVWLGLHYTCTLDFWFWVDDHRVEFSRWNDPSKQGDCDMSGAISRDGNHTWFTKSDYDEYNFICTK